MGCGYQFLFSFFFYIYSDIEVNPGPKPVNIIDILHLNIRSIRHKLDHLNSFIHDFDNLCLTETHLDISVSNDNLLFEGFNNIIRKDRNCFGDGIMIYLSNHIRAIRRPSPPV